MIVMAMNLTATTSNASTIGNDTMRMIVASLREASVDLAISDASRFPAS